MADNPSAQLLRAKNIGALVQAARQAAGRSAEECAAVLGVSTEALEAIEQGEQTLSLPELESLAYYLETPLEHFWDRESLPGPNAEHSLRDPQRLLALRHRMIGAMLRQARLDAGYTLEALAERAGIDLARLEAYELGRQAVPLPELEALVGLLHRSIREFQDQHGPVGAWNAQQRAVREFLALPVELQIFVSKPVNRPYLELAARLNDMSVEKLRAVAEGLLEITY